MATSTPTVDHYSVEIPKDLVSALSPIMPMWGTATRPTGDPNTTRVHLVIDFGIQVQGFVIVPADRVDMVMRLTLNRVRLVWSETGLVVAEVRLSRENTIDDSDWAVLVRDAN